MDALKQKMLSMKLEKLAANKKSVSFQEKLKIKNEERLQQEETLCELLKTLQVNQTDCDIVQEELAMVQTKLIETEKRTANAEEDVAALIRRNVLLETDLEQTETRLEEVLGKLESASNLALINESARKETEIKSIVVEEKLNNIEQSVKEAKYIAHDADRKYEEVARKLAITEVDLTRTEARLASCELKITDIEEELMIVGKNMKSLEISEQEAILRKESYEDTIHDLTERLKTFEQRASEAERQVSKLQSEVDRVEDDLLAQMEMFRVLSEELDMSFMEIINC